MDGEYVVNALTTVYRTCVECKLPGVDDYYVVNSVQDLHVIRSA